jgi:excinuclease ABC subunit C
MERAQLDQLSLPDTPGVYYFLGSDDAILYVGKATSLRDRVRNYFSSTIATERGPLIAQMVREARTVTWHETDSVLDALVLEASHIKRFQPPYNSREKDDKSFNYVVVTEEAFPQVLVVRGRDLQKSYDAADIRYLFGPFTQGKQFRQAMRIIRKIFPFRDNKCTPAHEQKHPESPRPCFSRQIGLCPGVCTAALSQEEYGQHIAHLKLFFDGEKQELLSQLESEMQTYASGEAFEQAAQIRRTISALQHVQDVSLITDELREPKTGTRPFRIEAYDIAHTAGTYTTGVMTVVEDGEAEPAEYRTFRVRQHTGGSDTDALREVFERRMRHPEWPYPDLIVVDGGTAQRNVVEEVMHRRAIPIPVVAVVKNARHKPERIDGSAHLTRNHEQAILYANSEAHRFALKFHRKLRRRGATGS